MVIRSFKLEGRSSMLAPIRNRRTDGNVPVDEWPHNLGHANKLVFELGGQYLLIREPTRQPDQHASSSTLQGNISAPIHYCERTTLQEVNIPVKEAVSSEVKQYGD